MSNAQVWQNLIWYYSGIQELCKSLWLQAVKHNVYSSHWIRSINWTNLVAIHRYSLWIQTSISSQLYDNSTCLQCSCLLWSLDRSSRQICIVSIFCLKLMPQPMNSYNSFVTEPNKGSECMCWRQVKASLLQLLPSSW